MARIGPCRPSKRNARPTDRRPIDKTKAVPARGRPFSWPPDYAACRPVQVLLGQQPDHSRPLAADMVADHQVDQPGALTLLEAAGRVVVLRVGQPQMRPAKVAKGVFRHAFSRLGHQALALELRIEPEAPLAAADAVVGPQVDDPDQVRRPRLGDDRPVGLLAPRHLLDAGCNIGRRRRRPGRARGFWRPASARPPSAGSGAGSPAHPCCARDAGRGAASRARASAA